MTLILTTLRPSEVLITSDGRSVEKRLSDGATLKVIDNLQKIFPVPDHPLAIYHHGANTLGALPVATVVTTFLRQQNIGNFTLLDLAEALRHHVHASVRRRLETLTAGVFSFLVAGFTMHDDSAGIVEISWKRDKELLTCSERQWGPSSFIYSGSGGKQIPKPDPDRLKGSRDELRQYHKELMQAAIDAKIPDNPVGGHIHELLITREKWTWTLPPKDP